MAIHHAAPLRIAVIAVSAALSVGFASNAWAQAGATGGSSGAPGPANQSPGPTVPAPAGSGNAGPDNDPSVQGQPGNGNFGGTSNVPGLDQSPSSSGTTRGPTGGSPSCTTGATKAADCDATAPQR